MPGIAVARVGAIMLPSMACRSVRPKHPCHVLPLLLLACSSDSPAVTPAHKAVLQAAAGDWQPLLLLVMQEWEASPYHPG